MLQRFISCLLAIGLTYSLPAQIRFSNYQTISTGSDAEVVEIGDFNSDGLNDVILGTGSYFDPAHDYKLKIYLQDSISGYLQQPIVHTYGSNGGDINSICLGDLNKDGLQDVIIGTGNLVKVFYQNAQGGLGGYQDFTTGTSVDGVGFGDLNNDGLPDFVASPWNESYIRVFYQDSTGFNHVDYPKVVSGGDELKVFDMNQDGRDDVVFMGGQYPNSGLYIFLQDSTASLNNYITYNHLSVSPYSLSGFDVGDINQDGKVDMVASTGGNRPRSKLLIWNNHDSTNLVNNQLFSIPAYDLPEPVKINDLNCDQSNELITVNGGWNSVSVYEADSNRQFQNYVRFDLPYASHYNPYSLAIGDINNDGKKDIVTANYNYGLVFLYNQTTIQEYTHHDTLHWTDTSHTAFKDSIIGYSERKNWTQDSFHYFQKDTFTVSYQFRIDYIDTFEMRIRSGEFCNRLYTDSMTYKSQSTHKKLINIDTSLIERIIDSTNIHEEDTSVVPNDTITNPKDTVELPEDTTIANVEITIFPNPNQGEFFVELPPPWNERYLILKMYDSRGRMVYERPLIISEKRAIVTPFHLAMEVYQIMLYHKGEVIAKEKMIITQ